MNRRERAAAAAAAVVVLGAGCQSGTHQRTSVQSAATPLMTALAATAPPTVAPTPTATGQPTRVPAAATTEAVPPAPPLTGCPPPPRPPSTGTPKPQPPPKVGEAALPAPQPVRGKAASLAAVRGKGLWVTPFTKSVVDVPHLVARGQRLGLRSRWVRTGGTRQGYYCDHFLPELVPAAHAVGLAVIAWDFPSLSDPVADARRARQALAAGVDAFSPDVETNAEGVYPTPRRLALYLSLVRAFAGSRPVVATVPRPTATRLRTFPYRAFVPYADVFAPMVYWSCGEPGALVTQSLASLRQLLPVAPVGQGYDMGPEGGRVGLPSRAETLRFLDAARRDGALGASLWTVEHAGPQQLGALAAYRWDAR